MTANRVVRSVGDNAVRSTTPRPVTASGRGFGTDSLDHCVVALIDHQPQMLFGVANFNRQTIINNVASGRSPQ